MAKKTTKPGKESPPADVSRRKFLKVGAAAFGAGLVVTVAAKNAHAADSWGGGGGGDVPPRGYDPRKGGSQGEGDGDEGGWDRRRKTITIKDSSSY